MHKPENLASATVGALVASLLSGTALAQEADPETSVDVPAPQLTNWSNVNAKTVDADSPDGTTYIYPDAATKEADSEGDGTGSIAELHWELDDGSGRAPGIKAVTDDLAFPTQNCIMASGEREFEDEGTIVPKTCSDEPGSSKRSFLEIKEVGEPIDLVFETGSKDRTYKGVQDPEEAGDDTALSEFRENFGIGRIYRVLQKFINDTDERLVGVRIEVGTGVGDDFEPLDYDEYGVAFELRNFVDREFFVGNTGAGDREVWQENRFAHFSPKMFDTGERARFEPGFMDDESAGMFPPQETQVTVADGTKSQFIESGDGVNDSSYFGALTPNYFDVAGNQGAAAEPSITGNVFGYMLPFNKVPTVVERYDEGDAGSESDGLEAWWDGERWRYGREQGFAEVSQDQLQQWAAQLLGLEIPDLEDPTRYTTGPSDDFSAMNMDTYLYLGDDLLEAGENPYYNDGPPRLDSITVRYTAVPASKLGTVAGTEEPRWVASPAPALSTYMPDTGVPVAINDAAITERGESVSIDVLTNDLLDGAVLDQETATVSLAEDPANGTATLEGDKTVTYDPDVGFTGEDTFTYTVNIDGEESNVATVTASVQPPPEPDAPEVANDSGTTTGTNPVTIDILANDTVGPTDDPVDPDTATVTLGEQPDLGSVTLNADNTVTYQASTEPATPRVDYFTYTVTVDGAESISGLVIVRVDPITDVAPIGPVAADDSVTTTGTESVIIDVLANDTHDAVNVPDDATVQMATEPTNGTAEVNDNQTVTYQAQQGFDGEDAFTYTVRVDDEVSDPATVSVQVEPLSVIPDDGTTDDTSDSSSSSSDDNVFGCTLGAGGRFDPLMPALVLLAVGYLGVRRFSRTNR